MRQPKVTANEWCRAFHLALPQARHCSQTFSVRPLRLQRLSLGPSVTLVYVDPTHCGVDPNDEISILSSLPLTSLFLSIPYPKAVLERQGGVEPRALDGSLWKSHFPLWVSVPMTSDTLGGVDITLQSLSIITPGSLGGDCGLFSMAEGVACSQREEMREVFSGLGVLLAYLFLWELDLDLNRKLPHPGGSMILAVASVFWVSVFCPVK